MTTTPNPQITDAAREAAYKEVEAFDGPCHPAGHFVQQLLDAEREKLGACPHCDGKGKKPCSNPDHNFLMAISCTGGRSASESQCPECGYSGVSKCDWCNGTGKATPEGLKEERDQLRQQLTEVKEKNDEFESLFDIQHKRMCEAVKIWHSAHPDKQNVIPDLGALLEWLLTQLTSAEEQVAVMTGHYHTELQQKNIARQSLLEVQADCAMKDEALKSLLGLDRTWPAKDVITRLLNASEHLMQNHDCDCCGHETVGAAISQCKPLLEAVDKAQQALSPNCGQPLLELVRTQNESLTACKDAIKVLFKRLDKRREENQDILTDVKVVAAVLATDAALTKAKQLGF